MKLPINIALKDKEVKEKSPKLKVPFSFKEKKGLLALLILVVILIASVFGIQQVLKYFSKAGSGNVEFTITPTSESIPPAKTFTAFLNTKTSSVAFVRMVITFDKNKIKIKNEPQTDINNKFGTVIQNTTASSANSSGKYVLVLGLSPDNVSTPPNGVVALASFVFEPATTSTNQGTTINFTGSDMQVVSTQSTELSSDFKSASISINPVSATATPTSTPTSQPTTYPGLSWWSVDINPSTSQQYSYQFSVPTTGDYIVKGVVNAPDDGHNSFLFDIDNSPQEPTQVWDIINLTNEFEERFVSLRGNGTFDNNQFDPKVFNLSAGDHTLYIVGREPGTQLQQLRLESYSANPSISPTPTVTPTPTASDVPTGTPTQPPQNRSGDINIDGFVNIVDIGLVIDHYGTEVEQGSQFDPSGDGFVNVVDIGIIVDNYDL